MTTPSLPYTLLYDAVMIAIGSYGAFVIFKALVELEHNFSFHEILSIFKKYWYAILALVIAIILFLHQIFIGLNF